MTPPQRSIELGFGVQYAFDRDKGKLSFGAGEISILTYQDALHLGQRGWLLIGQEQRLATARASIVARPL
jgi:hypothetical protein